MKVAYVDCVGGASGDMLLAALVDAGVGADVMRWAVEALHLPGVDVEFHEVMKNGLRALQTEVIVPKQQKHRHYTDLAAILENSDLPERVKKPSLRTLRRIAEVEAGIHGAPLEEVHLHELGGDDTLVDIAGFFTGLDFLRLEQVVVSPLPVGRGFVECAHGKIPLPAPATLELLQGAMLRSVDVEVETVTPTGAALLTQAAGSFGSFPEMQLEQVGCGAGQHDLPFPNVLRLWLGEGKSAFWQIAETLVMIETNIDDMNPQVYGYLMERLFEAGALDVTLTPTQMKKNRPAVTLTVMSKPALVDEATRIILDETTTLGVRRFPVERVCLSRRFYEVQTEYGPIRIKAVKMMDGERSAPEYDDCRRAALEHGVPLRVVMAAAVAAAARQEVSDPQKGTQ